MTLYHILGVSPTSSSNEIKQAFRRLVKLHHPDVSHESKAYATKRFQEINYAYEILSDANKRREYDLSLSTTRLPTNKLFGQQAVFPDFRIYIDEAKSSRLFDTIFPKKNRTFDKKRK
jgi:DnaJ-class molecular chaperone